MQDKMNWKYLRGTENDFIDAPDWANFVITGGEFIGKWFLRSFERGNQVHVRCDNTTLKYVGLNFSEFDYEIIAQREVITAWDGKGIPPVGTECEYSLNGGGNWWNCKIAYIVGTQGIVLLCDVFEGTQYINFIKYEGQLKFRPVRSDEEKERDAAIEDMLRIFGSNAATGTTAALKAIYDAGYRKNG